MKHFYAIIFLLLFVTMGYGQITGPYTPADVELNLITKTIGELNVTTSGAAIYQVSIEVPQGVTGIEPELKLVYNSQANGGKAGLGWDMSGVSQISRISATKYHDGFIRPVDFSTTDRFALDGQRLILKSGIYGGDGAEYETEFYSNLKISSHGVSPYGVNFGPKYFKVMHPDGSTALYGFGDNSRSKMNFGITSWINSSNVGMFYKYITSGDMLLISKIEYVSRTFFINQVLPTETVEQTAGDIPNTTMTGEANGLSFPNIRLYENEIVFEYIDKISPEISYTGGHRFSNDKTLSSIQVKSQGKIFKKYDLDFKETLLGQLQLVAISSFSGVNLVPSAPLKFQYPTSYEGQFSLEEVKTNAPAYVQRNTHTAVTGDFNGDGKLDYILNGEGSYSVFLTKDNDNELNIGISKNESVRKILPAVFLDSNQKVLPNEGWISVNYATGKFDMNSLGSNYINKEYSKTHLFPNFKIDKRTTQCYADEFFDIPKEVLSGDFDGDGLTDLIVIEESFKYTYMTCRPGYPADSHQTSTYSGGNTYFIDMNRNKISDFVKNTGRLIGLKIGDKVVSADFNGDGKTDILVYGNGVASLYGLNDDYSLQRLWFVTDSDIKATSDFLLGDYNGDGKMDFLLIDDYTYYHFFYSTGASFSKSSETLLVNYSRPGKNVIQGYYDYSAIYSVDINNDGKTDLVVADFTYKDNTMYNVSKGGQVNTISLYKNKGGYFQKIHGYLPKSAITTISDPNVYRQFNPLSVLLNPKDNTEAFQLAFISNDKIFKYNYNFNALDERQLISIKDGDNISEHISYAKYGVNPNSDNMAMMPHFMRYPFTSVQYPNVELNTLPNISVVSGITTNDGLKKFFSYASPVVNMQGLGFLGFHATVNTSWFSKPEDVIKNVKEFDLNLRGSVVKDFSILGSRWLNFTTMVIPTVANNMELPDHQYDLMVNYTYASDLSSTKVFKLRNTVKKTTNYFQGTSTVVTNLYNSFNDVVKKKTVFNTRKDDGTEVLNKTENVATVFENSANDAPYYRSRVKSQTETHSLVGSPGYAGRVSYTYNDKGLVSQFRRESGNSFVREPGPIIPFDVNEPTSSLAFPPVGGFVEIVLGDGKVIDENSLYDDSGNLIQKSTIATDMVERVTKYKYDASGRFLVESTDIEGLVSRFKYDTATGNLLEETNSLGLVTSYVYNSFRLPTKITDYLNKSTAISYVKQSEILTVTSTDEQGGISGEKYDKYGNKIESFGVNNSGVFIRKFYKFNKYKQLISESDPAIEESSALWSTTDYDIYGRVNKIVDSKGKKTEFTYDKLRTIKTDGLTTKTSIRNTQGKVVSLHDLSDESPILFSYYSNGNEKSSSFGGTTINLEQDSWGRKTKTTDPDAGIYTYKYNALGELIQEVTPKGVTDFTFDNNGKLIQKGIIGAHTNVATTYNYNSLTKLLTSTQSLINGEQFLYNYEYDDFNRLYKTTENAPLVTYEKEFTFDEFGREDTEKIKAVAYGVSSEKIIKNTYKNGHHYKITDLQTGVDLIVKESRNERGQLKQYVLGNGIRVTNSYDAFGYWLSSTHRGGMFIPVRQFVNTFDVVRGNLTSRSYQSILNGATVPAESFTYDNYDRLTSFTDLEQVQHNQTYDKRGRITGNELGTFAYKNSNLYQLAEIELSDKALDYYRLRPKQQIEFNAFKSPVSIVEVGGESVYFDYNSFNQRSTMYYGDNSNVKTTSPLRRHYSHDGSIEVTYKLADASVDFLFYLGGDAYTAMAIAKGVGVQPIYYLHRDFLGSIIKITNSNGELVESRRFDPWGNISTVTDGQGNVLTKLTFIERGYTGHEHLQGVKLINMNRRLYDPVLRRFLSPDNFVQDPSNSQNYNRYSYAYQNPFKYTDESGEIFGTIISGAMDLVFNVLEHGVNVHHYDWSVTERAWQIDRGLFTGNFGQILNKWTWGLANTAIGNFVGHVLNFGGYVNNVTHLDGAVALGGVWKSGAFTVGQYIFGPQNFTADWKDHLFVHEYGHYLQSQKFGPFYLSAVAFPSVRDHVREEGRHGTRWYEAMASSLGGKYFDKKYGSGAKGYVEDSEDFFNLNAFKKENVNTKYKNPRNEGNNNSGHGFNYRYHFSDFLYMFF
ncbi:FG-GAP-like repeat-containing protein [Flavobacterium sp. HSC-61S13]|uniref:FG-GAP-like repeat-containing protein n=1 Tax=Flavobacterium sp. HSC-61S13 TaxID=2910963 RepID=UPI0020A095A5|nr:FG-GAP-like repeat-containing protein [Flavobacterium sp. HSC-61S13]MCP1994997.1 RHS repeat-associated protein [Flavobacterium sp. HSC-61S13]